MQTKGIRVKINKIGFSSPPSFAGRPFVPNEPRAKEPNPATAISLYFSRSIRAFWDSTISVRRAFTKEFSKFLELELSVFFSMMFLPFCEQEGIFKNISHVAWFSFI
jgi:hypothetical protein